MPVFSNIVHVDVPEVLSARSGRSPAFRISFEADGDMPFPQVIIWEEGQAHAFSGTQVEDLGDGYYAVAVPEASLGLGEFSVQIEGCRRADVERASPEDWVKQFRTLKVESVPAAPLVGTSVEGMKLYFGIHKHMHQPYYNTTDAEYWDGEKDDIFRTRQGAYTSFIPAAVQQYIAGGLPHAGLSTSFSGTLVEQLNRCAKSGLCGGAFTGWNRELRELARAKTALGNPRVDFVAFGFFHPLMPLIPQRDIVRGIQWHRRIIEEAFGVPSSRVLFPPETAFHVRMLPALVEAGVEVVLYDSIHRFRTAQGYPYAGPREGMLPPNPAEQVNPPADDWLELQNVWAGSKISPSLLKPEYVAYQDADGKQYRLIAAPCERYLGNEDARGGFGALQYPSVLGQVYDQIAATGTYDPAHPPFFVLHSDGDNYGGGADSYYHHNTGRLVEWLRTDPRFELSTVQDYLARFPPDPSRAVHIEPGSWSGADNGDPQFMKWFSRYRDAYSPDLNSWAVLTAFQNLVHSLEDARPETPHLRQLERLLLTAETSCYWYWTGQDAWDQQVTNAANLGVSLAAHELGALADIDQSGPTIFPPWVTPENPGGLTWAQQGLCAAEPVATVHTFVSDVAGVRAVTLVLRAGGGEERLPMLDRGPYPSRTGAARTAHYFTVELPPALGDVRYFIEATDQRGNTTRGALERLHLA